MNHKRFFYSSLIALLIIIQCYESWAYYVYPAYASLSKHQIYTRYYKDHRGKLLTLHMSRQRGLEILQEGATPLRMLFIVHSFPIFTDSCDLL